jgi:hypothetical protein
MEEVDKDSALKAQQVYVYPCMCVCMYVCVVVRVYV